MDDQAIVQLLERWRDTGEARLLAEVLRWLERWLRIPPEATRALGAAEAEAIRTEVLEHLLLGEKPLLLRARNPRAFARVTLKNRLLDALRQQARRPDVKDAGVAGELAAETQAQPTVAVDLQLEEAQRLQRAVDMIATLRAEERAALLLLHAPDRLSEEDWRAIAARHPARPPQRPSDVLERTRIASLLFPEADEAMAYERTGKLIQRAYEKLRRAFSTAHDMSGEETP